MMHAVIRDVSKARLVPAHETAKQQAELAWRQLG